MERELQVSHRDVRKSAAICCFALDCRHKLCVIAIGCVAQSDSGGGKTIGYVSREKRIFDVARPVCIAGDRPPEIGRLQAAGVRAVKRSPDPRYQWPLKPSLLIAAKQVEADGVG